MSAPAFALPTELEAAEPPERRGLGRDEVRLMVVARGSGEIAHATFRDLPEFLDAGDLVVINNSATLPAGVPARLADGTEVEARFATRAPGMSEERWWVIELRSADGAAPRGAPARGRLELPGGAAATIVAPYAGGERLWIASVRAGEPVEEFLLRYGHPIRYGYVPDEHPLPAYQTAFGLLPGSAEMPSAGRPFTPRLVTALVARGVQIAPVTLHAGVSSPERGEPPIAERFEVPEPTARLVTATRRWGGRVIAVGTTVVRALETAARLDGSVAPAGGWTSEVITPRRGLRAIDGLITGWHEPEASHLNLLEAALGPELLARSYDAALERGYLWHEFGDAQLVLP
ncbi:MAG TPA: S-adenosylmethionine:tRNA ribosyltransferase-isomerase [Solirubrobacterales bacterium]